MLLWFMSLEEGAAGAVVLLGAAFWSVLAGAVLLLGAAFWSVLAGAVVVLGLLWFISVDEELGVVVLCVELLLGLTPEAAPVVWSELGAAVVPVELFCAGVWLVTGVLGAAVD